MKRYIKTALLTILFMLVLTGGVGVLIGKAHFSNQKKEDSKNKEEMDMNLYGVSKVSIDGLEIYELELSGEFKNVETFTISGSLAALSITVLPFALTAASIIFIVAPTEAKSK